MITTQIKLTIAILLLATPLSATSFPETPSACADILESAPEKTQEIVTETLLGEIEVETSIQISTKARLENTNYEFAKYETFTKIEDDGTIWTGHYCTLIDTITQENFYSGQTLKNQETISKRHLITKLTKITETERTMTPLPNQNKIHIYNPETAEKLTELKVSKIVTSTIEPTQSTLYGEFTIDNITFKLIGNNIFDPEGTPLGVFIQNGNFIELIILRFSDKKEFDQ